MKRIKKLASLLLAMIMVLAMTMTAFAAEPGDGEVTTTPTELTVKEESYSIYQIFTGEYYNGVLSNIKWGKNAKLPEGVKVGDPVSEEILKELSDVDEEADDTEKLAVISKYAYQGTAQDTSKTPQFTGLTPGYYLVSGTVTYSDGVSTAHTLYVVRVVNGELSFQPKVGVPEVDKVIVDEDKEVKTNEASIGDNVSYKITGKLPSNFDSYNTYYYSFSDTLSKGLELAHKHDENCEVKNGRYICGFGITVRIDGKDWTDEFYINATDYDAEKGTQIEISIQDLKQLNVVRVEKDEDGNNVPVYADPANVTAASQIIITYDAILNENAIIAGENPNEVKLEYSNNPNDSGEGATTPPPEYPDKPEPPTPHGETPTKKVATYTTELKIRKVDEQEKPLPGVEFTLTGNGVNIVLVTEEVFIEEKNFTAETDGPYWKLKDGTYTKEAPTITKTEEGEDGEITTPGNEERYDDIEKKYKKEVRTKYKKVNVIEEGEEGEEGKELGVTGTVGENGYVTFTGLGAGEYTIKETNTLPGYNSIDPVVFTVKFTATETTVEFTIVEEDSVVSRVDNNTFEATIINKKGSLLPSTGGIGTTIFYVVGGILVIGAGILLVAKKRMSANK